MPEQAPLIAALEANQNILISNKITEEHCNILSPFLVFTDVQVVPKQAHRNLAEFLMGLVHEYVISREGASCGTLGLNNNCIYVDERTDRGVRRAVITASYATTTSDGTEEKRPYQPIS
jgi:hypothetical protein